jgi:predicted membrane protein
MHEQAMNFLFPNDFHIMWSLMIVLYPYITGLVAGAFIVSSLYHVFGRNELKPVARLSMVASLSFLLVATMPLLAHLGHPERALNIVITPHFTSAMSAFGLIYAMYLVLVVVEIWLIYRKEIIETAMRSTGFKRWLFSVIALGVYDISDESREVDHRIVTVLAAIGIPAASILHGYVGFMFGSVKANAFWSTPLMPIIFLFSAVTSGIAMILILYEILTKIAGRKIDGACVQSLAQWLWLFATVTVTLELLEIVTLSYAQDEEWLVVGPLIRDKIAVSFIGIQMIFGSLIPFILLAIVVLMRKYLTDTLRHVISFIAAFILLIQVFSMRWNVVIGGQIFSKSGIGFREPYVPELGGREGAAMAMLIVAIPFVIMLVFNKFLPLTPPSEEQEGAVTHE